MKHIRSKELLDKALAVIPSATQTFSKGPRQYPLGAAPVFIERGSGSHVWDIDGNEFIDYPMGLGPVILGHASSAVDEAITGQLSRGIVHSLPHPLETELAELLTEIIPCAEMVRFGKNGSDATSGAVRAARAFTGREKIACCGYHGWQDWYIATTTRNAGIPAVVKDLTLTFRYNDIESLAELFARNSGEIAAVIMEPVGIEEPADDFLQKVKEMANRNGAILIFDEVVTGFRFDMGGAQKYFNVIPDMACFGKAMANGMPISAVVGRKDIMAIFDEIFFSFTFAGECLSLAAALATIREMQDKNVIAKLWDLGGQLKDGYNAIVKDLALEAVTECKGYPPHTVIVFEQAGDNDPLTIRTLFQQEALARGILAIGVHNICYSHSQQDIDKTLSAYRETLSLIKDTLAHGDIRKFIKGEIVQPVFRKP